MKRIYNSVKLLKNKNDISYEYIKTIPEELQNLLLNNDRVKEFNKDKNIIENINNNIKEDIKDENKLILNENKNISKEQDITNLNDIKKTSKKNLIVKNANKIPNAKTSTIRKKKNNTQIKRDISSNLVKKKEEMSLLSNKEPKDITISAINPNNNENKEMKNVSKISKKFKSSKRPFGKISFKNLDKYNAKAVSNFELND